MWRGEAKVLGVAASQGSKSLVTNKHTGKSMMLDADRNLKPWRREMQAEMRECAPPALLDGPVMIELEIHVRRPQSHYGTGRNAGKLKPNQPSTPRTGRDADKVLRACFDAATGIWWTDDKRAAAGRFRRVYAEVEAVIFRAWALPETDEPAGGVWDDSGRIFGAVL